jgi:hypothetical protein
MRELIARYPNRPEAYSILLENELFHDNEYFDSLQPTKKAEKANRTNYANQIIADADAARKIDPENGYFLVFKTDALIIDERNDQAVASLNDFLKCSKWDDYENAGFNETIENIGKIRIWQNSLNNIRSWTEYSYFNPEFIIRSNNIQRIANDALLLASNSEKAGDIEKGYEIRKCVLMLGKKIEDHSGFGIESMTGGSIEKRTLYSSVSPGSDKLWELDNYAPFLRKRGHMAQAAEIDRVKSEIDQAESNTDSIDILHSNHIPSAMIETYTRLYLCAKSMLIGALIISIFGLIYEFMRVMAEDSEKQHWAHPIIGKILGILLTIGLAIYIGLLDFPSPDQAYGYFDPAAHPSVLFQVPPLHQIPMRIKFIIEIILNRQASGNLINILYYPNICIEIIFGIQFLIAITMSIISKRQGKSAFIGYTGSLAASSLAVVTLFLIAYLSLLPPLINTNEKINLQIAHELTASA